MRMTWIHSALGRFLAVACLSVVLSARDYQHGCRSDLAIKRLALLGSYVSLFVIVASSVRRGEVRAFTTYTLGLAASARSGSSGEYRLGTNLFYKVTDAVLRARSRSATSTRWASTRSAGARCADQPRAPLEAVAMMAMALPIVIVGG